MTHDNRIRIGVSACLMGEAVRYDGSDKQHPMVLGPLAHQFRLVPICPETAIGLPTPRPPLNLADGFNGVRAILSDAQHRDLTDELSACASDFFKRHAPLLGGMVLKSGSPSCACASATLWRDGVVVNRSATGLFTARIQSLAPTLPLIEESALATSLHSFVAEVLRFRSDGL